LGKIPAGTGRNRGDATAGTKNKTERRKTRSVDIILGGWLGEGGEGVSRRKIEKKNGILGGKVKTLDNSNGTQKKKN